MAALDRRGLGAARYEVTVLYFGGNGHATARLDPTRRAHLRLQGEGIASFDIAEAAYPGFEGRARSPSFDAFVEVLIAQAREVRPRMAIGTGIGGLIAVCLRSRGALADVPLYLHAPVLWGLETRWMPRLVRPFRRFLPALFDTRWYQRRFVRKQFVSEVEPRQVEAFFDGYARCEAFADLFDWLRPSLLRDLERRFAANPTALDDITVWWGSRDAVVTPKELSITEEKLGVSWPLVMFDDWAHYPMIEAPESFARALAAAWVAHDLA